MEADVAVVAVGADLMVRKLLRVGQRPVAITRHFHVGVDALREGAHADCKGVRVSRCNCAPD